MNTIANKLDNKSNTRDKIKPSNLPISDFSDAYQGAREELEIWKKRALEAEENLRQLKSLSSTANPILRLKCEDEYGPLLQWYKHWTELKPGTKLYDAPVGNIEYDVGKMADRLMGWPLPKDFYPDGGISFDGRKDEYGKNKEWPIGTNLFTHEQAKAMFEYVLT